MPLTDYLEASGQRVHAEAAGRVYAREGEIWISRRLEKGIDLNLCLILAHCVDTLGLKINIHNPEGGAYNSRIRQGREVVIDDIAEGGAGAMFRPVAECNDGAVRLVRYLHAQGFKPKARDKWGSHPFACICPEGVRVGIVKRR